MRVYAHVGLDGRLLGLVTTPDGERRTMLIPAPGGQEVEIEGHGLTEKDVGSERLGELLETSRVEFTPARGKLVRGKRNA